MKTRSVIKKPVFILTLCTAVFLVLFCFFKYIQKSDLIRIGQDSITHSESRQLKKIFSSKDNSIKYYDISRSSDDDHDYTIRCYFDIDSDSSYYLSDAIDSFKSILLAVDNNKNHTLCEKRIKMEITEPNDQGTGMLTLANYYTDKTIDVFQPDSCVSVFSDSIYIDSIDGLAKLKDALINLDIAGINDISMKDLSEFTKLSVIKLVDCRYPDNKKALSKEDTEILQKQRDIQVDIVY